MSSLPSWLDIDNATSSQVSADGPMLCDSQDGPTIEKSGQEVVLANLSARQAKEQGLLTSGTYGPPSTGSLNSAALTLSLVSRLRARMVLYGGILYRLTWKDRVTPAQRLIPALRASRPPTQDNGYIGWQTPRARGDAGGQRWRQNGLRTEQSKHNLNLEDTTRIFCLERGKTEEEVAQLSMHPTFVRRLMGYPPEWDSCGGTAMRSSRIKRRNISKRTVK